MSREKKESAGFSASREQSGRPPLAIVLALVPRAWIMRSRKIEEEVDTGWSTPIKLLAAFAVCLCGCCFFYRTLVGSISGEFPYHRPSTIAQKKETSTCSTGFRFRS